MTFAACNNSTDEETSSSATQTTEQSTIGTQSSDEKPNNEKEDDKNSGEEENNTNKEEDTDFNEPEWTIETLPESSAGLELELNEDGKGYTVVGIGTCTDTEIVIGKYNNLPVTQIRRHAFENCDKIIGITIGGGVEKIGGAFKNCKSLTKLNITNITSWCNVEFEEYSVPLASSAESFPAELYYNGTLLEKLIIPNGVKHIPNTAFAGRSIKEVYIPNSVTSIGESAFAYCRGLASITIPDSVTKIEGGAFGATGITSITIPNSVTSIGKFTFSGCTALKSITIPNSVTSIGAYVFEECNALTTINFQGTKAEWKAIKKYRFSLDGVITNTCQPPTDDYTVHCTDGDIAKADDK